MMNVTDKSIAEHYFWGNSCSGWHLLQRKDRSIIEECVLAGESEKRHFHEISRQFFYILQGEAVIEIEGTRFILQAQQGIEVPPKSARQFCNVSNSEVRFLVISMPKAQGDRVEV